MPYIECELYYRPRNSVTQEQESSYTICLEHFGSMSNFLASTFLRTFPRFLCFPYHVTMDVTESHLVTAEDFEKADGVVKLYIYRTIATENESILITSYIDDVEESNKKVGEQAERAENFKNAYLAKSSEVVQMTNRLKSLDASFQRGIAQRENEKNELVQTWNRKYDELKASSDEAMEELQLEHNAILKTLKAHHKGEIIDLESAALSNQSLIRALKDQVIAQSKDSEINKKCKRFLLTVALAEVISRVSDTIAHSSTLKPTTTTKSDGTVVIEWFDFFNDKSVQKHALNTYGLDLKCVLLLRDGKGTIDKRNDICHEMCLLAVDVVMAAVNSTPYVERPQWAKLARLVVARRA